MSNMTPLEKDAIAKGFRRACDGMREMWFGFGEIESIIGETDLQGLNEMVQEFADGKKLSTDEIIELLHEYVIDRKGKGK